ncbi:unnamed protein product [Amoebophrya sp. A25]|nr:unnamed protein product [Amoebophrya sp. A25]|eukprot:GSA25T00001300001.1
MKMSWPSSCSRPFVLGSSSTALPRFLSSRRGVLRAYHDSSWRRAGGEYSSNVVAGAGQGTMSETRRGRGPLLTGVESDWRTQKRAFSSKDKDATPETLSSSSSAAKAEAVHLSPSSSSSSRSTTFSEATATAARTRPIQDNDQDQHDQSREQPAQTRSISCSSSALSEGTSSVVTKGRSNVEQDVEVDIAVHANDSSSDDHLSKNEIQQGKVETTTSAEQVVAAAVPSVPLDDLPVQVQWKISWYCGECGKYCYKDEVAPMRKFCGRMWRKYMEVDDRHCPLFLAAKVKDDLVLSREIGWKDMPRIKGRS